MFTGLVEETGTVTDIRDDGPDAKWITLRAGVVAEDAGMAFTRDRGGHNSLSVKKVECPPQGAAPPTRRRPGGVRREGPGVARDASQLRGRVGAP